MLTTLEWGRAALILQTDDAPLKRSLSESETLARASTARMQRSFDSLSMSQTGMQAGSIKATAAFSAMSQAGGILQNRMASMAGQVGAVGIAFQEATASANMMQTALVGLGAAAMSFYAGMKMAESLSAYLEEDARALLKASNERLTSLEQQHAKEQALVDAADARLDAALGLSKVEQIRLSSLSERTKAILIELETEIALTEEENKRKAAADALEATIAAQRESLQTEIDLLRGQVSQYDLILNAEKRALTITRDRLKEEKALTAERRRERQAAEAARMGRIAAEGPQTFAEAQKSVLETVSLMRMHSRAIDHMSRAVSMAVERLGLGAADEAELRRRMGLQTPQGPTIRFGTGAMDLSAFAGTGVAATTKMADARRENMERERTQRLRETASYTLRTAQALERGDRNRGAG